MSSKFVQITVLNGLRPAAVAYIDPTQVAYIGPKYPDEERGYRTVVLQSGFSMTVVDEPDMMERLGL